MRLALCLLLLATPALAGQYKVTFNQPEEVPGDCLDLVQWELWGARGATSPAKVATIPQTPALCAAAIVGDVTTVVTANLKHGSWTFTLRSIDADGLFGESTPLVQPIPPPPPGFKGVVK